MDRGSARADCLMRRSTNSSPDLLGSSSGLPSMLLLAGKAEMMTKITVISLMIMMMMMTIVSDDELNVGLTNRHQVLAKQAPHNVSACR